VAARGYHGVVVPARRGAKRCVLKLTWPAERTVDEAQALAAWRGQGAVLLLEADAQAGALLLERLDATRTLDSLDLRAAAMNRQPSAVLTGVCTARATCECPSYGVTFWRAELCPPGPACCLEGLGAPSGVV
jgi:hypothetical protein